MAKKVDFKNALNTQIDKVEDERTSVMDINEEQNINQEQEENVIFTIEKKAKKESKRNIALYIEPDTLKELDKVCKKTEYNRNEMINTMIKFCLANLKISE